MKEDWELKTTAALYEKIKDALDYYSGNTHDQSCRCQNTFDAEKATEAFEVLFKRLNEERE